MDTAGVRPTQGEITVLTTTNHRRRRILALLLVGLLTTVSAPAPSGWSPIAIPAAHADDDDDDGDDDGDDGDDGDDDDGDDDDDDGDDDDGDGDGERRITPSRIPTPASSSGPARQSTDAVVDVTCIYDVVDNESTCEFVPDASPDRAIGIQIPTASVCAPVERGDYVADVALWTGAVGETAYTNASGATGILFVFDGIITTTESTAYAVQTGAGWIVAAGPRLSCTARDGSPTAATNEPSGSVTVFAYACSVAEPPNSKTFNWTAECPNPAPGLAYHLYLGDDQVPVKALLGDKNGVAHFRDLIPGTYRLDLVEGAWCHAESDRVNGSGEVEVAAGQRSTVWIFQCAAATM